MFKRVETYKGLFAIEKISLIYNLLTSLLIVFLYDRMDHPAAMLWDRVLIAAVTFVLMYLYRLAPCRFASLVRVVVQMSLLSYWYPDTYEFNRLFPNLDHLFAAAEQGLFGGQPAIWFSQLLPQMWVSEPLNLGYFFYYPMMVVIVLWYFIHRYDLLEKISFVIITSFFIYYFIYIFLPVAGPQFYFPAIGYANVAQGIFPCHRRLLQPPSGTASRSRLRARLLLQPGGKFPAGGRASHGGLPQFARGHLHHYDDYGVAGQPLAVCLPVAALPVVVRRDGVHPGTLPHRCHCGLLLRFCPLLGGDVDVQEVVCPAVVRACRPTGESGLTPAWIYVWPTVFSMPCLRAVRIVYKANMGL